MSARIALALFFRHLQNTYSNGGTLNSNTPPIDILSELFDDVCKKITFYTDKHRFIVDTLFEAEILDVSSSPH